MRRTCPICKSQGYVQRYYFPALRKKLYMCDECYSAAVDENFEQSVNVDDYMDDMQPVGSYWLLCFSKKHPRKLLSKIETKLTIPQLLQMSPGKHKSVISAVSGVFFMTPERIEKLTPLLESDFRWDFANCYYFLEFDELLEGTIDIERHFQDYPCLFAARIKSVSGEVVE